MKASLSCGGVCISLFLFLRPHQGLSLWIDVSSSTTFNIPRIAAVQSFGFSGHTEVDSIGNTFPLLDSDAFTLIQGHRTLYGQPETV